MNDVQEQLEHLVTLYGPDKVKFAVQKLLGASSRPMPAEYIPILAPSLLERTVAQLERALDDVKAAGYAKENVYRNKADLVKQQTTMEAAVKLAEAEAFMQIEGEGRDQYVMEEDKKIALNNDAARDAFRRRASAEERRQAANLTAQINAIDVELAEAGDAWFTTKEAVETIRAKAYLQAALLNFLAGRDLH
ncbi:hypothetical protein [Sporomusa aerivorans]|uniref:hypothetical protein n=1 Tax=Sporomusa aerivorans TaxID=204936 RepID=UPI00352AAB70